MRVFSASALAVLTLILLTIAKLLALVVFWWTTLLKVLTLRSAAVAMPCTLYGFGKTTTELTGITRKTYMMNRATGRETKVPPVGWTLGVSVVSHDRRLHLPE